MAIVDMKPKRALPKASLQMKPILALSPTLEIQMEPSKEIERLQALVDSAVDQHPDSIQDATEAVLKKANRVAWFEKLKEELIRRAIAKLIHDTRHQINVAMRNASGEYGGPAKVVAGAASGRIAQGVMAYLIAGKTLGMLTGDELRTTADSESEKASGHQFNVRLCTELAKTVRGANTVGQKFTLAKLTAVFEKVKK